MATVTSGMIFKKTTVKCEDPFDLGCSYIFSLPYDEEKTLSYCFSNYGWHKDESSGKLACPSCWDKQQGNYERAGTVGHITYNLVFHDKLLMRINLKTNYISLENVAEILNKEKVSQEDKQKVRIISNSWAEHWSYGDGIHDSSISIVIER